MRQTEIRHDVIANRRARYGRSSHSFRLAYSAPTARLRRRSASQLRQFVHKAQIDLHDSFEKVISCYGGQVYGTVRLPREPVRDMKPPTRSLCDGERIDQHVAIWLGDFLHGYFGVLQRCSLGIVVPVLNWFPRSQAASFPRPATFSPHTRLLAPTVGATVMTAA